LRWRTIIKDRIRQIAKNLLNRILITIQYYINWHFIVSSNIKISSSLILPMKRYETRKMPDFWKREKHPQKVYATMNWCFLQFVIQDIKPRSCHKKDQNTIIGIFKISNRFKDLKKYLYMKLLSRRDRNTPWWWIRSG